MARVAVNVTDYPSILTVTNLVRSDVRDDMKGATGAIGEGQILVDNMTTSLTMANFFNSAVRELCRQMRQDGAPNLINDNYILTGIPPINGPMGNIVMDPAVQVYIGKNGYFDGTKWWGDFRLPPGCFQVMRVWERMTGSTDNFIDLGEPANGMYGAYQTFGFGRWEWRQDQVCLPGSIDVRDIRLRYWMLLQAQFVAAADPSTTYLPIMDCEEAIARKITRMYAFRQGGTMLQMAKQEEQEATYAFLNEIVQRKQGNNYETPSFGSNRGPWTGFGY